MILPYDFIGKVAVYLFVAALVILLVAMSIGAYSFKKKKILFPGFVLFVLDLLYFPAKQICRIFSIRSTIIDEIQIEIRNAVNLDKFIAHKKDKALFGPQCMRHPECKARCDPITGYKCIGCGKCDYTHIKKACEKYGYKLYIIPGGSFVKKIMKTDKPKIAFGIACFNELNESMHDLSPFVPVQGVPLSRDGCFNTAVNVDDVIEKMRLCSDDV